MESPVVHVVVAWALISGTARRGLEIIKKPLEAAVIQEVTTTIVIEPDWTAELHETGVYLLDYTG